MRQGRVQQTRYKKQTDERMNDQREIAELGCKATLKSDENGSPVRIGPINIGASWLVWITRRQMRANNR